MSAPVKIAGVQMEPRIGDVVGNLARCLELLRKAALQGARLVVFPEVALSGYVFSSLEEALPVAEMIPGPSTERLGEACRALGVYAVVGMLEKSEDKCFNASVLVGPGGLIGRYRKLHLPYLGVDRFCNHGDLPPVVYDTEVGRIGLCICYDLDFPELTRVLALMGAEIIVAIANWPEGIEFIPGHVLHARARENLVHVVGVNRVGQERGATFFGRSKFVDCLCNTVAEARPYEEDIIYAELDPAASRRKHQVIIPGELEIDMVRDRRPEFYSLLTEPLADRSRIR